MKKKKIISILLTVVLCATVFVGAVPVGSTNLVNVTINTNEKIADISPYIYGVNYGYTGINNGYPVLNENIQFVRLGGNRMTGYNWENNYSNAGSDWNNESDDYMVMDLPYNEKLIPARTITDFHENALKKNVPYSLATLQMAGYVAKDGNKEVLSSEVAPSSRWAKVEFKKNAPFSLTPDTSDDVVYMDEEVNYLVNKFGDSTTETGIKGYSLDNEPGLWSSTHSRLHPDKVTCKELVERSVDLSSAVKDVDKNAEIFGPALYGFAAYQSLQSAPDWESVKGSYNWFIDYYLDEMNKAEQEKGRRLLDVLDLHYYSEDTGDCRVTSCENESHTKCNETRVQSTRTLWDKSYVENSWIGQWCKSYLPIIPTVQESIDKYYKGTKLAFTEYSFGGENLVSGGIAEADALGIFGENNVYAASLWKTSSTITYAASALELYTNYDGNNSQYGDEALKVVNDDIENSSVYSALDSEDENKLHIILINKDLEDSTTFNLDLTGEGDYSTGEAYGFDSNSYNVSKKANVEVENNKISYTLPKASVYHLVLTKTSEEKAKEDVNKDGNIDLLDLTLVANKYRSKLGEENFNSEYDINGDNVIDITDIVMVAKEINTEVVEKPQEEEKTEDEVEEWKSGVSYKIGDKVTYKGKTYECINPHTSNDLWTPDIVQSLWK